MDELVVRVTPAPDLLPDELDRILTLCHNAYGEDLAPSFGTFQDPVHLLGYLGDELVSHALWIVRWLQVAFAPPLRTGYVEAVATGRRHQGRGYGSAVLRRLVASLANVELAALCPSDRGGPLYQRLGWELWQGPLYIRRHGGLIPTPEESLMILRLPRTPALDLNAALSAEWRAGELW